MNRFLTILFLIILASCNNSNETKQGQSETLDESLTKLDSIVNTENKLPLPLDIKELKRAKWLTTTSGVVNHSEAKKLCIPNDSVGFYGFYSLIDKTVGKPLGILTIHTTDENWRFDTPNEQFAEINLTSSRISVWDSIRVGLNEENLLEFIGTRFHYKKGSMIYSELDSYVGIFIVSNDTIKKLTIRNICIK